MKPAEVTPLLRQAAGSQRIPAAEQPLPDPGEREVAGCWIDPGWSAGLRLNQPPPQWPACDPEGSAEDVSEQFAGGSLGVMVARADRSSRVTVCGWLVGTFLPGRQGCRRPVDDELQRAVRLPVLQRLLRHPADRAAGVGPAGRARHAIAYAVLRPGPRDNPRQVIAALEATAGRELPVHRLPVTTPTPGSCR